jgi:hypothetical protein
LPEQGDCLVVGLVDPLVVRDIRSLPMPDTAQELPDFLVDRGRKWPKFEWTTFRVTSCFSGGAMRCVFAALAIGLLVAGCDDAEQVEQQAEQPAKNGPSLEEHYQKQVKAQLDKIREDADRKMQDNMKIMSDVNQANRRAQDDIRAKQGGVDRALGRSDKGKERPELPSLPSSRGDNRWRSGN